MRVPPLDYIVQAADVERRRVLLERLGYERFLANTGAKLVQEDYYGRLWQTDLRLDDEPVTVVEVINSTAEPTEPSAATSSASRAVPDQPGKPSRGASGSTTHATTNSRRRHRPQPLE